MSDNGEAAAPGRQTKRGPVVDLKGMSAAQLRELIAEAEAELVAKQEAAKTELRAKWQAEAAEAGLTLDAVTLAVAAAGTGKGRARKPGSSNVPVKYRGPNGEEWSGRGRSPRWVQVAEAEGKSLEDFRV
jgi:DNA-binding protein H-NS